MARIPVRGVAIGGLVLLLVVLAGACGGDRPVIRAHTWESGAILLNNAIFEFIVEEGYGYPVEIVVETTPVLQESLPEGEVDLNLEGWQQNIPEWYDKHINNGDIVNLGMIYEGGPQYYLIPRWVAEEYGIETVFDMKDHWELFQDPQDPSKGVFYNCLIGTQCREINTVKLEAYGLVKYFNLISPASEVALTAALARPQESRKPVFGFAYAPSVLFGAHDWYVLEEPPYSAACWAAVTAATGDDGLRPIDEACAYEVVPIETLAHKGLLDKAPDVVEMLRKMVVGLEPLSESLAWADQNGVDDWNTVALRYLRTYEARWKSWVTPRAFEKIKLALGEVSG